MAAPSLTGRRVLITGASSGIGAAAAEAFARAGADVALLARSREGLEAAAATARGFGGAVHVVPADVADRPALEAAVQEAVDRLGGLDVLVSNAAAMVFGRFDAVDPDEFDRTVEITFTGAVNAIRAALPHLERSAGGVVVTGSIMAKVPLPAFAAYTAAKHALRGFLGTLRVELQARGSPVTVSIVNPGAVDTPLWDHVSAAGPLLARNPPDLYSARTIARALVAAAIRPRPEFTVGGEARIVELGWALARPVADFVLTFVSRYYASGRRTAPAGGLLREATGEGRASGGRHGRPSLWAWLRLGGPYRDQGH